MNAINFLTKEVTVGLPAETRRPFVRFRSATVDGDVCFSAGFPTYPANFHRDVLLAALLSEDVELLESQLMLSAKHQGTKHDPLTGEKPGKVPHEIPGVRLPGRGDKLTTYNACDTSALFLIGAQTLLRLDRAKGTAFIAQFGNNLRLAAMHIEDSLHDDGLYWETPPEGADSYALRVTYWKDSRASDVIRNKREPTYPVSYALAHFIAARGLLAYAMVIDDKHARMAAAIADDMFRVGIARFMSSDAFTVYIDNDGPLVHASSDELHALAFIPRKYRYMLPLSAISRRARQLETPYGYMCLPRSVAHGMRDDDYHADVVWVFEQAMIHWGASKFRLVYEASVASKIQPHIGQGQELFSIVWSGDDKPLGLTPRGNSVQLWSEAADWYFSGTRTRSSLLNRNRILRSLRGLIAKAYPV